MSFILENSQYIRYHLMNNKKTTNHEISTEDDVDIICQQINKNKEEIELFYARNKMKLPPILQSKNIIFKQKIYNYLELPSQSTKQDQNKRSQNSESSTEKIQGKHFMEKQPSIRSIRFSKSKQRRSEHSNTKNKKKEATQISIMNKTNNPHKKYYLSLEKQSKDLTFFNETSSKDPAIEQFLSEMMKNNKSIKKTTFILAKCFEIEKRNELKRNEQLYVNQTTSKDPELLTISNNFQLHAKKLTIEHQIETERKPSLPRASRNASCYNNQTHTLRKRQASQKKQRFFQPWQHQYIIQEDFFCPSTK